MRELISYTSLINKFVPVENWWKYPISCGLQLPVGVLEDNIIYEARAEGNLLIAGDAGSGTTNYLRFIINTIIRTYSPKEVYIYLADGLGFMRKAYYDDRVGTETVPHVCFAPTINNKEEFSAFCNCAIGETHSLYDIIIVTGCDAYMDYRALDKITHAPHTFVILLTENPEMYTDECKYFKYVAVKKTSLAKLETLFSGNIKYDSKPPVDMVQLYTQYTVRDRRYKKLKVPLVDLTYEKMAFYAMAQRAMYENSLA